MEKKVTVFIYLPGETMAVPAGIFTHEPNSGVGLFAYGKKYLERGNAFPVDPIALPLGPAPREVTTNKGLYGALRDAAPDYWGRLVIAAEKKVPPEALSEMDFLLNGNATRVGNLDFRIAPDSPEPRLEPPHFSQMQDILDTASKIEAGEVVAQHFLRLLRQGTSLGGARPKCTMEWEDALWIAKFPAKDDTLNIPRIEYAAMTLAGKCGIRVPAMRIESVGGRDVLLVKRFDRRKAKDGWLRQGFLSSLSLMQWDESDRLKWSYGAVADTMRRHAPVEDIRELFRRMVFNILVRNTDDHPRNHGFLFENSGVNLSPAYDIVPTISRPGVGTDFDLAMSVGDCGREASLDNALSRAVRFGYSKDEAKAVVDNLVEIVRDWRDYFSSVGCPDKELQALGPSFIKCEEAF